MILVKENNLECWVNDNNERHGECKWWYENGQLRAHSFYVNGKRHGEYKSWWGNGQLSVHCFYVNGEWHGEYKWWYRGGQLEEHYFYVNDEVVRDLIKEPVSDEDKFLITLETGAKWI